MDEIIDAIIAELDSLRVTEEFSSAIDVVSPVKWDDPMLVTVDEYPYIYVAPVSDEPMAETAGRAGYDIRRHTIQVGIVINAADYFDPLVAEVPGARPLVVAADLIRARLRRLTKRRLDGLSGVRNVVVQGTAYGPDLRNNTFVKMALTTITVERQYQHEE